MSTSKTILRPVVALTAARLRAFALFTVSTLLMIELREKLDAATTGDRADAAYKQGL